MGDTRMSQGTVTERFYDVFGIALMMSKVGIG